MSWHAYKKTFGVMFSKLLDDPDTLKLGAYENEKLLGFLVSTPGKRVNTLHWVQVKFDIDGTKLRRRGVMNALLSAADLGKRFVYTLRARKVKTQTLDEILSEKLLTQGVTATFVPLQEWFT